MALEGIFGRLLVKRREGIYGLYFPVSLSWVTWDWFCPLCGCNFFQINPLCILPPAVYPGSMSHPSSPQKSSPLSLQSRGYSSYILLSSGHFTLLILDFYLFSHLNTSSLHYCIYIFWWFLSYD